MNESSNASSVIVRPVVSVVMPVYNAERYLREAIDSICNQALSDWELVVVDDGSNDATPDILRSYSDARIHIITHERNLGLVAALNAGVDAARGEYVARIDADDIALPMRLEQQVRFLISHPSIDVIGSRAIAIDGSGNYLWKMWRPQSLRATKYLALFETPLFHPTVMARASVFKKHAFNSAFRRSEDYDLWSRLVFEHGIGLTSMSEHLILFRQHTKSFTKSAARSDLELVASIPIRNLSRYLFVSGELRNVITAYRSGTPMRIGQYLRFAILVVRAFFSFLHKEKPTLPAILEILRITLGLLWRSLRRALR